MTIIVETHNITRVEHDIQPSMASVITLPLIIDGSVVEGICVYLTVSAFGGTDKPSDSRLRLVAQEIAIKLQRK